jgi:phage tail-like protein
MAGVPEPESILLQYLPAICQEADEQQGRFLERLLAAFEKVLLGREDAVAFSDAGLEEEIAALPSLFDPWKTPSRFLEWLAGWAALALRADTEESEKRKLIASIIPLYRWRGTRRYLERLIELFTGGRAWVIEPEYVEFQIAVTAHVGRTTFLGGPPPYTFHVVFTPPPARADMYSEAQRLTEIARSVISLAKPAHTYYTLSIALPGGEEDSRLTPQVTLPPLEETIWEPEEI